MINLKVNKFELKKIELIIFDKDGTIIDSHYLWQEIINRRAKRLCEIFSLNEEFEKKFESVMGLNPATRKLKSSGPIAIKSRNEVINTLHNFLIKNNIDTKEEILENLFFDVHRDFEKDVYKFVKPIPSCVNFINKLDSAKVKLALITSDSTTNAIIAMKKLSLFNRFELVLGNDKKLGNKKDGYPAKFACEVTNINPINTIAIGDTIMDHEMALNANIKASILISSGQISLDELQKSNPYSLSSLDDVSIK